MSQNDEVEGRGNPVPLTPLQYRFMRVLQARMAQQPDIGPTYAELMEDMGLRSKSGIARLVDECVERGWISKLPNRDRSLVIIHPVSEGRVAPDDILSSFSDRDILLEAQRRGLVSFVSPQDAVSSGR